MKLLKKIGTWIIKRKFSIISSIVFLVIGAGVGAYFSIFVFDQTLDSQDVTQDLHELSSTYKFVSPLLECNPDQNIGTEQAEALQNELQLTIKAHEDAGDITTASVYFRDLNGGPYVDVNADQLFSPGSLLKVPLAMSIYKEAESDPTVLQKELQYTGQETNDPQYFAPASTLPSGTYTVDQLVTQMLVNSDNNAANVLAVFIGVPAFEATYLHIGVPTPPTQNADYTMTVRSYASFFSVLYNATYLTADDSEHLLSVLSQSTFNEGIVAGVPKGTVVSHKFGERGFEGSSLQQLHDCGIVYVPDHPYLLCIMTQGYDYPSMAKAISDISNVTYNYVE